MPSSNLICFNKPWGVLCQFTGDAPNLSAYIPEPGFYPAGRLDKDSEGLVLLTSDGRLQSRIADPAHKMEKTYIVQVEGEPDPAALENLRDGVALRIDGKSIQTRPARVSVIDCPLPPRDPPIRYRRDIPTSWLELKISEGRNRQVRRMTAAVNLPTLRLFRRAVGPWSVEGLAPGEYRHEKVNLPR